MGKRYIAKSLGTRINTGFVGILGGRATQGNLKGEIKIQNKQVRLKRGTFNESTLVDKVCSDAQRKSYHRKERFASGKHQSMFLDTLARYCDYEYDPSTKKYTVLEVYKNPKTLYDSKIHKGIYQYLAPLILYEVLYGDSSKDRQAVITSADLARTVKLVNANYNSLKFNQTAAHNDLDFSLNILAEYFNKADNRIDDYVRRCISYLAAMNCVIYNETHMIGIMPQTAKVENGHILVAPGEIRKATDDEMTLYSKLVEKASRRAKITSDREKWYGKKSIQYNHELIRLLKEHGILFICRAFTLWRVDEDQCKRILRSFNNKTIDQRRQEIGAVFKVIMDSNAEKRLEKNQGLGANYIEQFKRLSDITLLCESDDVLKFMPSVNKKNYQSTLQEKYGYEVEYGLRGDGNDR